MINNNINSDIQNFPKKIAKQNIKKKADFIRENNDEFIGLTKKEISENEERGKKETVKITPLWCGKDLNWNEMEDCSDEVIEKLKEINIDDYYAGLLKISDKMK